MTKQAGMGDNFYVSGYDLSGDIGSLSRIGGGPAPLEVTGIDKSGFERLGGERDGAMEFSAWFNPDATAAHGRLSLLPTTDQIVTYARGTTLGNPAASQVAKQINYDPNRGEDGSLAIAVSSLANGFGLEWGEQLTAGKRSDTTATNGTGVDFLASTSFSWQAWLHVFSFTGTSVTVTLEDSADNISFAPFTGSAFTAATGITSQRLPGGALATVRRYVRAVTTGTFSQATFSVMFTKNKTLTAF